MVLAVMTQTTTAKRLSGERGHTELDWLDSWHSFSFADYHDPEHHSFRALRVINEDRVAPGRGFPQHPHRDMEILTYVVSGHLSHRDSMGHVKTVGPGQVQYMSAGGGLTHSEYNASASEPVHFLQIWIVPHAHGLRPAYAEWARPQDSGGALALIAAPEENRGSLTVRQDVSIYLGKLKRGESTIHSTRPDRGIWLQMISGETQANEESLQAGDGLALEGISACEIMAETDAEFLLFDLT